MTTDPGVTGASRTLSEIEALAVLDCASAMLTGIVFRPEVVLTGTVARYEKTLSPDVASPFVPLSKNACDPEPPIELRSPVTVRPVLVGLAPGVTVTVSVDELPAKTVPGL